jgi:zinc protease
VPAARRVVIVDSPDLVQARILLAHEGISRSDPDRIAAVLMNVVLGGSGFGSRLMARVRSEAGLTYSVNSGFSLRREPGPFVVATFTRVAEVRRVIDLLLGELERARSEPPDARELGDARTLAVGEFALGLETPEAVMSALVDLDVYALPADSLDDYRARVRGTTTGMTAEAARRLLHPERAAIVLVGPAAALTPQLEGLGPIETLRP